MASCGIHYAHLWASMTPLRNGDVILYNNAKKPFESIASVLSGPWWSYVPPMPMKSLNLKEFLQCHTSNSSPTAKPTSFSFLCKALLQTTSKPTSNILHPWSPKLTAPILTLDATPRRLEHFVHEFVGAPIPPNPNFSGGSLTPGKKRGTL